MQVEFSLEEKVLLALLKDALGGKNQNEEVAVESVNYGKVLELAQKHAVLPLLYNEITENDKFEATWEVVDNHCRQTVLQSYRLLFLSKYLVQIFTEHDIKTIVLKGVATASFYSVPELRKSGDIDLFVPENISIKTIIKLMNEHGFREAEEQHANHHMVFYSQEGIGIEIHSMLAEPFTYKGINQAMKKHGNDCMQHVEIAEVMGVKLPILDKPFHAYELLLHMLQHFMYAGFGLKLLCDWIMLWRKEWSVEEKTLFTKLVKECGVEKFAESLTAVCIKYLGLPQDSFAWSITINDTTDLLLREFLDSEEFGNSNKNRMVMMSGTGFVAYVREFQHQMYLNFPKLSKCFLLWPVLWVITLVRFLRNNKRVRNTSAGEVLKEAKRRSELMKQLNLFR